MDGFNEPFYLIDAVLKQPLILLMHVLSTGLLLKEGGTSVDRFCAFSDALDELLSETLHYVNNWMLRPAQVRPKRIKLCFSFV